MINLCGMPSLNVMKICIAPEEPKPCEHIHFIDVFIGEQTIPMFGRR